MIACSDSAVVNSGKVMGSYAGAAKKGQKKVLQINMLYTFINKQVNVQKFPTEQKRHFLAIKHRSTTVNVRWAQLSDNASISLKEKQAIALPIMPNKIIVANADKSYSPSANVIYWHGVLQKGHGFATLVLTKYGLSGMIQTDSSTYKIETFGHGKQVVIKVNDKKLPLGFDNIPNYKVNAKRLDSLKAVEKRFASNAKKTKLAAQQPNELNPGLDNDVLVIYTPSLANAKGSGLMNLIN
jgi:UDP-N-acetylglucosamine 2-epimerase